MPEWEELGFWSTGDVIGSGWANNITTNFDNLNGRTGGEPTEAARGLFVSDSLQGEWRFLRATDYRDGTIPDTALANWKMDAFSRPLPTFGGALGPNKNGFFRITPNGTSDPPTINQDWYLIQAVDNTSPFLFGAQIAMRRDNENEIYFRLVISGSVTPWRKLWHFGNSGDPSTYVRNNSAQSMAGPLTIGAHLVVQGGSGLQVTGGGLDVLLGTTLRSTLAVLGQLNMGTGQRISFPQEYGRKIALTAAGDFAIDCIATADLSIGTPQRVVFHNAAAGPGDNSFEFDTNNRSALFKGPMTLQGQLTVPSLAGGVTSQFAPFTHTHDTSGGGGTLPAHVHTGDALTPASVSTATVTASGQLVAHAAPGTPPLVVDSGTMVANLNVARVGGKTADELLSGGASPFTTGMIMYFDGSPVPTGWTFVPSVYQGKFLVSAGGVNFPVSGTGGNLTHNHGLTLSHSGGDVGAPTGSIVRVQVSGTVTDPQASRDSHEHDFTQPSAHAQGTPDANHLPPYIAVNMIRKT